MQSSSDMHDDLIVKACSSKRVIFAFHQRNHTKYNSNFLRSLFRPGSSKIRLTSSHQTSHIESIVLLVSQS